MNEERRCASARSCTPPAAPRTATGGRTSSTSACCTANSAEERPDGRRLRLRRGVQEPRPRRREGRHRRGHDRLAGLVARRLRPLRPALHPHGLARAGTYRISDGRGGAGTGQQRFAPLNSWPDNGNLDKARRLLWPVKKKYGNALSWADLLVLAGNVALESMGFETFGFGGGRADVWEPEQVNWGAEAEWLGDARYSGDRELDEPARRRPDGPHLRQPRGPQRRARAPLAAARDIRETFARMAMNDEETVALIAGGHTFGKTHGAGDPNEYVGREPEAAPLAGAGPGLEEQPRHRQRRRRPSPAASRAPGPRRRPRGTTASSRPSSSTTGTSSRARPARTSGSRRTRPRPRPSWTRTTRARRTRRSCSPPTWRCASTRPTPDLDAGSYENPDQFADAFARAWFKLTHRDMGPKSRATSARRSRPRSSSGRTRSRPSTTRWSARPTSPPSRRRSSPRASRSASSSPPRGRRPRRSAAPTSAAAPTVPASASPRRTAGTSTTRPSSPTVLGTLEGIQAEFNASHVGGAQISLADLIVLAGGVGVEKAAKAAGHDVTVPFTPGPHRRVAGADRRRLLRRPRAGVATGSATTRARARHAGRVRCSSRRRGLLTLTAPEMTVLVGGLRVLGREPRRLVATACSPPRRARSRTTSS